MVNKLLHWKLKHIEINKGIAMPADMEYFNDGISLSERFNEITIVITISKGIYICNDIPRTIAPNSPNVYIGIR